MVVVYAWQLQAAVGGKRKASTFSFFATLLVASDQFVLSLYTVVHKAVSLAGWYSEYMIGRRIHRCTASYDAHLATAPQLISTQHDMLLQHTSFANTN